MDSTVNGDRHGASTDAVWAGETSLHPYGAAVVPIIQSIAFGYNTVEDWLDVAVNGASGHIYSRNTNPTVETFEEKMRHLESAEAATSFASGMAAISNTLFTLLKPGDRVVAITDTYGGTNQLFLDFLPRLNVSVTLCPTDDEQELESALALPTKVLYLETPTNPTLKVVDVGRFSRLAHQVGAVVVVDNTVATPINQNPLALGADLVVHSASKFLGGHGDALGGVVCGSRDLVRQIYHYREITGASLGPFAAYLLLRGLKTLGIRVERHNANAMAVAQFLFRRPEVESVYYPGLPSHRNHDVARRQMRGFGGMLSFTLQPGGPSPSYVLKRLRLARRGASLGHVETFAGIPATTSHVECTAEERAAMGIPETLIRYSVGIEDPADLLSDLEHALTV